MHNQMSNVDILEMNRGYWNKSACYIVIQAIATSRGFPAELGNHHMKRKWRRPWQYTSESHKITTLYVLWLLLLLFTFNCEITTPIDFIERSTTRTSCPHVKNLHIRRKAPRSCDWLFKKIAWFPGPALLRVTGSQGTRLSRHCARSKLNLVRKFSAVGV